MAQGDNKLFDVEAAVSHTDAKGVDAPAVEEPKLLSRSDKSSEGADGRLEALYYKERYRQKLRRGRTVHTDDTEQRLAALREAEKNEAGAAMESLRNETQAHTDRITELLSRIEAMEKSKEEPRVIDMALGNMAKKAEDAKEQIENSAAPETEKIASDIEKEAKEPETRDFISRVSDREASDGANGVITISSDIKSEVLRIGAAEYRIGGESIAEEQGNREGFTPLRRQSPASANTGRDAQHERQRESSDNENRVRYGAVYTRPVAYPDPERRLYTDPERTDYPDAERRLYTDPERTDYPDAERRLYTDPERVAYPDAERRLYTDPERVAYPDAERRLYTDPERVAYPDAERRLYTDPERVAYPDAERGLYTDPERTAYPDAERRLYTDPERVAYPDAERRLYTDPERVAYPDAERRLYTDPEYSSYADPEALTRGGENYAETRSVYSYSDDGNGFITRRHDGGRAVAYTVGNVNRAGEHAHEYPDPETASVSDPEAMLEPSYPDPVLENRTEERPLTAKERKRKKKEEARTVLADAIRFEREMQTGVFTDAHTPDPEYNEYGDVEGREYPDPEAPTNSESDWLLTADDPNSLYDEAKNTADELLLASTKPKTLKRFIKRATALDIKRIKERCSHKLGELKLELRSKELRFAYKKEKEARSEREIRADMNELISLRRREIHRARVVGRVSQTVLLTDFSTAKLKRRTNRAALIELRAKLLHLLTERYYFDENMIAVYKGSLNATDKDGRRSAQMRGIKRAYRIQKRIEREVEQNRVSPGYKKKIYSLMNEFVELSGEFERVLYSLKHERPRGAVKRELKRQKRRLRRKLARTSDYIDYYKKRGIERAEEKREVRRNTVLGWIVLLILLAAGVLVYLNWDAILLYFNSVFGATGGV